MDEFLPEMIPELQKWNGGTGIDLAAFVHVIGRFDHAIAYAHFFWPTFRVHDDCVLLAQPDAAVYEEWLNKFDGRRASVEAMLNHVHVYDAFLNNESEPSGLALSHLTWFVRDMWSCKLARDFPDRAFEVRATLGSEGNPLGYEVTFFQIADARRI